MQESTTKMRGISVGKASKCTASEVKPGVFVRKDDKIKSIGILGFKQRSKKNIEIPLEVKFG